MECLRKQVIAPGFRPHHTLCPMPDVADQARAPLIAARRIVVKVGSAVLARAGVLDPACIARLAEDLASSSGADRRFVLVSSGAVASGFRALGLKRPPSLIADKQAAAAVGQPRLMAEYAAAFAKTSPAFTVAQVLLTADDIDHRTRFLNARHTLERLLESHEAGVIPIVNENDSVTFTEIKLGDNDRLSALVASLVSADALIVLSSVPGVLAEGSGGKRSVIPEIRSAKDALPHISAARSDVGVGGMATKVGAACEAAALGVPVVIADGAEPGIIRRILAGEALGTYFPPAPRSRAARERWIGFAARPRGVLQVDAGAVQALTGRGASLLPSGLTGVQGEFAQGALVELHGPEGAAIARGLASYSSADLTRIKGKKAAEIESILGFRYADEVVHRDDMVLLR